MNDTAVETVLVRDAAEADMPALQAIYAHHVLHGLASFEIEPPDVAEMTRRWRDVTGRGMPYRVATVDGKILGYAYVAPYRARPAYRYALEDSVYVAAGTARRGIGRRLLGDLIEKSAKLGYRQMIAVIGDSANHASIGLHERLGFARIGTLPAVGFKFGRWVDSVLMQRALGEGAETFPTK